MNINKRWPLLIALFFVSACGVFPYYTSPTFSKASNNQVFNSEITPAKDVKVVLIKNKVRYREIGVIVSYLHHGTMVDKTELINAFKEVASKNGANAIMSISITDNLALGTAVRILE